MSIYCPGATNPSPSDNANNTGFIIGISGAVVVVVVIVIVSILVYRFRKYKRNKHDSIAVHEEPAQDEQPGSNEQRNRELPPIPDVESVYEEPAQKLQPGDNAQPNIELSPMMSKTLDVKVDYEEPARYQHLDSSKRVSIDANYQGLNAHYSKLDGSLNEEIHEYTHLNMNDNSENDIPQELEYVKVLS